MATSPLPEALGPVTPMYGGFVMARASYIRPPQGLGPAAWGPLGRRGEPRRDDRRGMIVGVTPTDAPELSAIEKRLGHSFGELVLERSKPPTATADTGDGT